MKYLTMVARSGMPKAPANVMNYTLIGDDFSIHTMSGEKLAIAINDKKVVVTNMAVSAKGLVSTNGAIDKYTLISPNGGVIGTARAVILNRVESNGKLAAYVIFGTDGTVHQITVAQATQLATAGLLANGKIRHTAEGDIVSAIGGNYPLLEIALKVKAEKPIVDLVCFDSTVKDGKMLKYAGVIVTSKDAIYMRKLFNNLETSNKKLIEKMKEDYGYTDEDMKSFTIIQAPGAGFYGMYPLTTVDALIKQGKVKCSSGNLIVGCMDGNDLDAAESMAVYNIKKKAIVKSQEGTEKSDAKLKKYIEDALKRLA